MSTRTVGSDTASTRTPELEVRGLAVRFGGLAALEDVSVQVARGSSLGIVGPNGAGKTTLLNAISGLQPVAHGEVCFRGQRITGQSASRVARLGLGRSFQLAEGFASFTVWDYVRLGLAASGNRGRRATAASLDFAWSTLDEVGLLDRRTQLMGVLPYGARKLVDLCRAVVSNPHVLLLDEPTSGLSKRERVEMVGHLHTLRSYGDTLRTVVVVDHDVSFISEISDEMLALASGCVIANGTPGEVMSDPRVKTAYLG